MVSKKKMKNKSAFVSLIALVLMIIITTTCIIIDINNSSDNRHETENVTPPFVDTVPPAVDVILPPGNDIDNTVTPSVPVIPDDDIVHEDPNISTMYYNVTPEEREMLAKVAHLEASICSQECQEAVISVIFNRLESGRWRKDVNNDGEITLYDIVYYPWAFSPVSYGMMDDCEPTSKDYAAVDAVLTNGPTVPTYVRYFRANYHFSNKNSGWETYVGYCSIDNVYFGYFSDWEKGTW